MVRSCRKSFFLTTFGILILPFLFGSSVFADAEFSTITMTTTDANFSVSPTETGNFVESMTPAIINVTTNNYTGYKLTLESTSSTAPALTNLADNSKTIPSITSTISENDFLTSSSYNNMWGISPSKLNSVANSNYIPAPTTTAITLEQTNAANPTTPNTYSVFAGTRINYLVEAGYYSATLIAKTVINPATYTIIYADSSSSATNMPSTQSGNTSNSTIGLSSNTPSRGSSYTFQGWCTSSVTSQDTDNPSCSGTTYQPSATMDIDQTTNNLVALNAIWMRNLPLMQDVLIWGNTLLPNTGDSIQAKDSRDNKKYWVTRLADGNIWMTQNLDFVISTSGTTLTTSDSDVLNNKTLIAGNHWQEEDISFYEGEDKYLPSGTGSATLTSGLSSNSADWHYHVGNYYNWTAATAGSGTHIVTNADATESICPKGWRLPTSNSYTNNYSFGKLTNAYGITNNANGSSDANLLFRPLWFVRAGEVYDSGLRSRGSEGGVWSSWAGSISGYAASLYFEPSRVRPSRIEDKRYYGRSVRCVAREKTMQNVAEWKESLEIGDTVQVKDRRDGEMYLVGKLADGKIWMLDNLRLGGGSTITLTSADTNISSSYTLPAARSWIDSYTTAYINSASKNTTTTSYGSGSGRIGVYYNYCAASAGTICSSSNSSNASYDICPKGWRLPTGGSSGEFKALYTAYSSNASSFRSALSTPLSGLYSSYIGAEDQGNIGYFWASTRSSGTNMHILYVRLVVSPTDNDDRMNGFSIRCISQ